MFVIKKVENALPWTYVNDEEIVRTFYGKELKKINKKAFRTEKVIKRKDDKLYVKWWKGYDNLFNSSIHKKYISI